MFGCRKTLIALALVMAIPVAVSAQTADKAPAPGDPAQPASQSPPTAELLKPQQLEALVAPIALYPDELLANVLAASTYPLEVVQADRWLKERKALKGDALKKEVEKQSWDDSVKALASTPDVLTMMSDKIDWTKNLGDAVIPGVPAKLHPLQKQGADAPRSPEPVVIERTLERVVPWGFLISVGALVGAAFPGETRAVTKIVMRNGFRATEWMRGMTAEAMEKGQDVFVEARSEYDHLVREAQRDAERGRLRVVRGTAPKRTSPTRARRRRSAPAKTSTTTR